MCNLQKREQNFSSDWVVFYRAATRDRLQLQDMMPCEYK